MIKINVFAPKSVCAEHLAMKYYFHLKRNEIKYGQAGNLKKLKRKKELLRIYAKEMTFELWMW